MSTKAKKLRNKKAKRVLLGVGHPWFEKVDGPGIVGYQKVMLLEGDWQGDALTLKIGKLSGSNKVRLYVEVIS